MVLPVLLRESAPRRPADEKDPLGTGRHRLQSVLRIRPPIPYSATPFSASLRKSPAIFEEVGDFLAQVKKKVYFCRVGIEKNGMASRTLDDESQTRMLCGDN